MWCHLPTGLGRLRSLRFVAMLLTIVALFTTLFFAHSVSAVQSTNKTVSFQGRLQTATGAVVADGHYNMQFKIYQDGSGASVGNPGGSLKWTESYINNGGTNGVEVRNGYFSVSLGSLNSFGTSVDWDQDTMWLSMNVAGTSATCTTFGSAPCGADGEMLPMKRITATPYAINAGAVGGKTADNFIQMAQGVQTDASTNTSSIHINKTGTGNLIQLQNAGSNVFSVTNSGDLEFGSGATRAIYIGNAPPDTSGNNLVVHAGYGGSGTGSIGGGLFLQGGSAGGDNGEGGSVAITGGVGTGTGKNGSVYIGASDTDTVQIGSNSLASGSQTINIGNSTAAGGSTNITIGNGGSAASGTTTVQAKNSVTIKTNDTTRATFSDTANTVYFGNGVSSAAPSDFTIQGTDSSATAVAGGALTVQGGNATAGNANGGNVTISGGAGNGTGASGLVVLTTPTFQTVTNDANCYTGGTSVAASCTISLTNVNNSSAVIVGFSAADRTATLPDPTIKTAGRVFYVSAANGSQPFTLRANVGAGTGVEQNMFMKPNTTTTMFWNGTDWTAAGGTGSTTLQDAYNNTQDTAGDTDIDLYNGLTIRHTNSEPANNTLLQVQNSATQKLFSINSGATEYASNPGAEVAGSTASTFPIDTWGLAGTGTVTRNATPGKNINSGNASVYIASGAPYSGGINHLKSALTPGRTYSVSVSARLESGTFTDFGILYVGNGNDVSAVCQENITLTTTEWKRITCSFTVPSSGVTADNTVAFGQMGGGSHYYYIDDVSVAPSDGSSAGNANITPNVQIGGNTDGSTTLFTVDKAASAPTAASDEALLGSMYYDTTIGKVRCFEAEGWGSCGANPDTFVTLSPEFPNAVTNGTASGTMTSDFCSDALNINNSGAGTTVCGTNETYNFYKWAGSGATDQTKGVYVTYKLPSSFKKFAEGTTSLMARTDNVNSTVNYQVYRNTSAGLTACGAATVASTGVKTTWQKGIATTTADPANCNFAAGDDMVIRINMTGRTNANTYVSNLAFTFNNK